MLSSTRTQGFASVNPISLGEIKTYMDIFGVTDGKQRRQFIRRMKFLDGKYMKWQNQQHNTKEKKKNG